MPGLYDLFNGFSKKNINRRDSSGQTQLYKACREGSLRTVRKLLQQGADPDIADHEGLTPLHVAAHWGETAIVEMLLKNGANPNADAGTGWTPLHSAALSGGMKLRADVIGLLLGAGAKNDIPDGNGWTSQDYMQLWQQDEKAAAKLREFVGLKGNKTPIGHRPRAKPDHPAPPAAGGIRFDPAF